MPSKAKKNSKAAASRLSNSNYSAGSPQTPLPLKSSAAADLEINEHDLALSLQEASGRYPNFIGKSAFIGHVTDVESDSRGCKIWLSEASMLASSLAPGSLVSVSLAASTRGFTNSFPLSSFLGECTKKFELELVDETASEAGNYFAFATVFPSSKVVKNGILLSSNLSYTMGCPAAGRYVFVYPVRSQLLNGLSNGNNKPEDTKIDNLSVHNCNELFLEFVPLKDRVKINSDMWSRVTPSVEKRHDQSEYVMVSSPKTPLHQPRFSSRPSQLSSAGREEAVSFQSCSNGTHVDSFDIKDALRDESAKKLLQSCATSWLNSRILVCGNLVAIPVLSVLCIFRVINVNKLPKDTDNQGLIKEKCHRFCSSDPESVDHMKDAFFINYKAKVYLCVPNSSAAATPQKRDFPSMQIESEHVETIMGRDNLQLGGLHKEYSVLKDIIISSMKNTLSSFGLRTTKGVLLHGPPGTGKTSLARLCVLDAGVNLFSVNGPEIISQYYGESEQAMHKVFDSASQAAPAVVFIDELDAIAPARKDGGDELSQRIVATLLNLMDGISSTDGLLVIAATNRPDSIDPALRRPGRLDREIEIGVPSPKQRLDILQTILGQMEHSLSDVQIQNLAMSTHGFVGADLAAVCNEAGLVCLRRYAKLKGSSNTSHSKRSFITHEDCFGSFVEGSDYLDERREIFRDYADSASSSVSELHGSLIIPASSCFNGDNIRNGSAATSTEALSITSTEALSVEQEFNLKVVFEDFEKAKLKVRPSAMREVVLEVPKVNWEDVGGQGEIKNQLMEAVEWPQRHQDAFKRVGVRPPTGILMFGPPGCSKTLMARAVASEAGLNFLAVKGPELFSKWVGESEKAVRSLFAKARANAPSIIFFDEIDGLAVIRGKESDGVSVSDRVMSQLLVELDGLHQRVNVTVLAATNRPDKVDPALLRPGRFDRLLYVGPPNKIDREDIFRIHLRKIPCSSDVSIKELACLTDGCTGADISLICREAAIAALEENVDTSEVTMQNLKSAIGQVQPSEIQSYQELSAKFQRLVHTSHGGDNACIKCSDRSHGFSFWTKIKSSKQFLIHILASDSKPACNG